MRTSRACSTARTSRPRTAGRRVRILITGAGGFAGQHLLRDLLAENEHELFAGTLSGEAGGCTLLGSGESAQVRWLPVDVRSPRSVASALRTAAPDRIFHLAAQSSVAQSFQDPLATWTANATGTVNVLYQIGAHAPPGARVLVVSSGEVYGVVPDADQPIPETYPVRPPNPYSASKAASETVALQVAGIPGNHVVVARSFPHTGPGQDPRFALSGFAAQLANIRAGGAAPVLRVGNLSARRDYMDVRDTVRAYRHLLEHGENGGLYNVCSGYARSIGELLDEMIALSHTGARVEIDPDRFRPVDVPLLCGDPARLRNTGWFPALPLERTLADLIQDAESRAAGS